jgi:uncharacterized cupin superfamily protein
MRLLLDSSATAGAVSAHRVHLASGMLGANPHTHSSSSEVFYVLDGRVDVLVGDEVVAASAGDLLVVPPDVAHAFGATGGHCADLLVMVTPGIERFEFFRQLQRVARGDADPAQFMADQSRYDTYPAESSAWETAR